MFKKVPILIFFFLIFFVSFEDLHSKDEYFLTLRNEKVNLRQGPSFDYPVKILYKKKFLPVLIQDSSDNFRKIRDHENNSGWIHISQLSKKKAVITIVDESYLYKRPTIYARPLAILKKGRLVMLTKCRSTWCKVRDMKFSGWIKKDNLWGKF